MGGSKSWQIDGLSQSAAGVTSFKHHTGLTFPLGVHLELLLEAEFSASFGHIDEATHLRRESSLAEVDGTGHDLRRLVAYMSPVGVTESNRSVSVHDASTLIKIIKLLVGSSGRLERRSEIKLK